MNAIKKFFNRFSIIFALFLGTAILGATLFVIIDGQYVETIGDFLAKTMSWFFDGYKEGYGQTYGTVICYGYLCIFPSCLFYTFWRLGMDKEPHKTARKVFLILYIVLAVATTVLYYVMAAPMLVALPEPAVDEPMHFLFGFLPVIPSVMSIMCKIGYIWVFFLLPLVPNFITVFDKLQSKLPFCDFEDPGRRKAMFWLLVIVDLLGILITAYLFIVVVLGFVIGLVIWMIHGFCILAPGAGSTTSDSMHHVDGDTYADSSGNYYTYDGDSYTPKDK